VHGANRLGGNSLLDTIVFGKLAGGRMAAYVTGGSGITGTTADAALADALTAIQQKITALQNGAGTEAGPALRVELQETMFHHIGVFRDEALMTDGLAKVRQLLERYKQVKVRNTGKVYNMDLLQQFELKGMIDVAEAIAAGALARKESRGSHARRDFTERDDLNFLRHTVASYTPDGVKLDYRPVTITRFQPEARKY